MDAITTFLIKFFKEYGIWASIGLLFLYGLFTRVVPKLFDWLNSLAEIFREIGIKVEKSADKNAESIKGIMDEFKEDRVRTLVEFRDERALSRAAHKLEIDSLINSHEKILNNFITLTQNKLIITGKDL